MSLRESRLQNDVKSVVSASEANPRCPFEGFVEDNCKLKFVFKKGSICRQYELITTEDYPNGTYLICLDEPDNLAQFDLPLPLIFNRLTKDLLVEMESSENNVEANHVPPIEETIMATSSQQLSQDPTMEAEIEALLPTSAHPRLQSTGLQIDAEAELSSDEEYYNANDDDSDAYDYDEDYYDHAEGDNEEDVQVHPLLAQDMECIQLFYGEEALTCRVFGSIDFIDVELHLSMSFLDPETANAWKVKREEPMVIRLHLSLSGYLDAQDPKVEVFQPSQKENFGVGSQLRKILESFVTKHWKDHSNSSVIAGYTKNPKYRRYLQPVNSGKKRLVSQHSNIESTTNPEESMIDDGSLAHILDMGFSQEMARNALIISRGNVEDSINLLLSNPERCKGISETCDNKGLNGMMEFVKGIPKLSNWITRQHTYPKVTREKGWRSSLLTQRVPGPTDLNLLPSQTPSGKTAKIVPGLEYGFLVQIMQYAQQRLPTLNEYCVVCDEPHVFENGAMLKPAVCARELCVFAFQTLGVMSDAAEDIATGAEVVDLLIVIASVACKSTRNTLILDPFPNIVNPENPRELAFSEKNKDFARVEHALDSFPEISEMMRMSGSKLKKNMDARDILSYPLLQWIISSNRSHIVKLPGDRRLEFMHTPHQFLLMSSPPAIEAIFRSAKEKHGSLFAFHGSHMDNWHRIMRVGLMNASGTKYQLHGAAYGKGIYLSSLASVSFGYSGMGHGGSRNVQRNNYRMPESSTKSRFLKSKNLTCIALCEVINDRSTLKMNDKIWVMTNPDYVCTRFFFMYEDGQVGDSGIDTQNEKYYIPIKKAIGYLTGEPWAVG